LVPTPRPRSSYSKSVAEPLIGYDFPSIDTSRAAITSVPAPSRLPAARIPVIARVITDPEGVTTRPRASTTSLATETRTVSPARCTREWTESIVVVRIAVPLATVRAAGAANGCGVGWAGGGDGRGRGVDAGGGGGGVGRSVYTVSGGAGGIVSGSVP